MQKTGNPISRARAALKALHRAQQSDDPQVDAESNGTAEDGDIEVSMLSQHLSQGRQSKFAWFITFCNQKQRGDNDYRGKIEPMKSKESLLTTQPTIRWPTMTFIANLRSISLTQSLSSPGAVAQC